MWIFYLKTLIWYEVQCFGLAPESRFSHSAAFVGTNLVIFGGINKNFCGADLFALELDPYHAKKAIRAELIAQ